MNYTKLAFLFLILNNQLCLSSQTSHHQARDQSPVSLKSLCIFGAGLVLGGIAHAIHQNKTNICDDRLAVQTGELNCMEELRAYYRFGYDPQRTADFSPYPQQHSLYWEYRGAFAQECGRLKRAEVDARKGKKK